MNNRRLYHQAAKALGGGTAVNAMGRWRAGGREGGRKALGWWRLGRGRGHTCQGWNKQSPLNSDFSFPLYLNSGVHLPFVDYTCCLACPPYGAHLTLLPVSLPPYLPPSLRQSGLGVIEKTGSSSTWRDGRSKTSIPTSLNQKTTRVGPPPSATPSPEAMTDLSP